MSMFSVGNGYEIVCRDCLPEAQSWVKRTLGWANGGHNTEPHEGHASCGWCESPGPCGADSSCLYCHAPSCQCSHCVAFDAAGDEGCRDFPCPCGCGTA